MEMREKIYCELYRKNITEKEPVKAEFDDRFQSMPELSKIFETFLYGKFEISDKSAENIEIHEFSEQNQETEYVAEQILELVKNGVRYKDITVVARDTDRYFPVISEVFAGYEIPVFVDKKLSGENQPAINAVVSALEVLSNNFSYESVFSYLKSFINP